MAGAVMDVQEEVVIVRAELHRLKAVALMETMQAVRRLSSNLDKWAASPLDASMYQLKDDATRILTLLGQCEAYSLADSVLDQ